MSEGPGTGLSPTEPPHCPHLCPVAVSMISYLPGLGWGPGGETTGLQCPHLVSGHQWEKDDDRSCHPELWWPWCLASMPVGLTEVIVGGIPLLIQQTLAWGPF